MNVDLLNDFKETKTCTYKGERYSVRDNGAVLRGQSENSVASNKPMHTVLLI